jgi:hypothetical protein
VILRQALLVLAHAALATTIIGLLWMQYDQRRHAVAEVRRVADAEHAETQRVQQDVRVQQDLLRGIKQGDPYVVEMLARDKLEYQRPGELTPPALPEEGKKPEAGAK